MTNEVMDPTDLTRKTIGELHRLLHRRFEEKLEPLVKYRHRIPKVVRDDAAVTLYTLGEILQDYAEKLWTSPTISDSHALTL